MRSEEVNLNNKHQRTELNSFLLDDLIENTLAIASHTDEYGIMDKFAKQCLKDAIKTAHDIDNSEDTITFYNGISK